jgi:hypothetical protein
MGWNYRVVKRNKPVAESLSKLYPNGYTDFAIYEVWYDKDGNPNGICENPSIMCGEEVLELKHDLEKMLEAVSKPVLDYAIFEEMEKKHAPVESDNRSDS